MRRVIWSELDAAAREAVLARPALAQQPAVARDVARVIAQVRADGDSTLRALTRRYDQAEIDALEIGRGAFDAAERALEPALKAAIVEARDRIAQFHAATAPREIAVDTAPGVRCERILRPIDPVGLYVPAGSAPLPSTALMLGVPAQLAGCTEVVLCSPPRRDGSVDPAVLYAASRCGITRVLRIGGAQAIAAMAYGTASVPRCAKLFGPGNAWVTEAKRQVSHAHDGPAIDLPAGPSEVLVVADARAEPRYVAADLLSQAEHGPDSQAMLVTEDAALADAVLGEVERQLARLPRAATAAAAIAASVAIVVDAIDTALDVANAYAPEHLILAVAEPRAQLARVRSAGSVFLGDYAPETLGDYVSGTNHVLPTYGHARARGGVSVASFQKAITVQSVTPAGLAAIGPAAMTLARAEGLAAHERAVSIRLEPAAVAS